MVAPTAHYTDVCDRPQTAHGRVQTGKATQAVSILLLSVGFKGGIFITALITNQVEDEAQRRNTRISACAVSYWISRGRHLSLWFGRKIRNLAES